MLLNGLLHDLNLVKFWDNLELKKDAHWGRFEKRDRAVIKDDEKIYLSVNDDLLKEFYVECALSFLALRKQIQLLFHLKTLSLDAEHIPL